MTKEQARCRARAAAYWALEKGRGEALRAVFALEQGKVGLARRAAVRAVKHLVQAAGRLQDLQEAK